MKNEIDRKDVAKAIAERYNLDADIAYEVLKGFCNVLPDLLAEYGRVEIHHLGVFRLAHRAPRHGVDPKGHEYSIPARQSVTYDAAPALAEIIEQRTGVSTY